MMERTLMLLILLLGFSSQCFAHYEDHYTCGSQSGRTQIKVDAVNRPDFEFSKYNSISANNSDENGDIKLQFSLDGKEVVGQVRILSATEGTSQDVTVKTEDGKTCRVGVLVSGIKANALVRIDGLSHNLQFNCKNNSALPDGAIECQ